MIYKCIVKGFNSGLNELLQAQNKRWDSRTKRLIVCNPEKAKNDRLCEKAIRQQLKGVKIENPVFMIFRFFVGDKKHDRSNIFSGFIKSWEDALQHCKVLSNDSYDLVLDPQIYFSLDRKNPRVEIEIVECIREKDSNSKKKDEV